MLENLYLDGKVVVITGGGTGLGLEMVRALTRSGANLAIAGRRPGPIEAARDEVIAAGQEAIAVPTDVANSSDADALIEATLSRFGRVDALINNAAMVADNVLKPIWEITDDEWETAMSVNLSGAFYCARAAARQSPCPTPARARSSTWPRASVCAAAATSTCTAAPRAASSN